MNVRMSAEERAMVEALAEREGVTSSDYIRLFIRRAYAEVFGDRKPKRAKR